MRIEKKGKAEAPIAELRENLVRLTAQARDIGTGQKDKRKLNAEIGALNAELNALMVELDSITRPNSVFDPGNPRTVGLFIALATTTQTRQPLNEISAFYGAGLYAIYYTGGFEPYSPISKTETPIYVGMALCGIEDAVDVVDQGTPLAGRLREHQKNIRRAQETLSIDDFEYRALVLRSGWESTAENYLIRLFKPIWNKETKILFGFGKHGDDANTRKNRRSPWDTLHAGRNWAADSNLTDNKSQLQIKELLKRHFVKNRVYQSFGEILEQFKKSLDQK